MYKMNSFFYLTDVSCPNVILRFDLFNHVYDFCLLSYLDICFSLMFGECLCFCAVHVTKWKYDCEL